MTKWPGLSRRRSRSNSSRQASHSLLYAVGILDTRVIIGCLSSKHVQKHKWPFRIGSLREASIPMNPGWKDLQRGGCCDNQTSAEDVHQLHLSLTERVLDYGSTTCSNGLSLLPAVAVSQQFDPSTRISRGPRILVGTGYEASSCCYCPERSTENHDHCILKDKFKDFGTRET
ncbi:hypothetical protein BJY00DRAFT_217457 [Aspergillus carlsbadensis]|nr:hypothetical protein BJY00DRAFT_217457 [Aspergillus carlsbadensis]